MNHYGIYQDTQAKQEVTWTECQHPDMSNTVRIHKAKHKQRLKYRTDINMTLVPQVE